VVTRPRPRTTRLLLAIFISISVAVISLDYRQGNSGPLAGLGRAAKTTMVPLQRAVADVTRPVGNFFQGVLHLPSLAQQNNDLQHKLEAAQAQNLRTAFDQQQFQTLKGLLGLQKSLNPPSIAAEVIANGVSNFAWSITLNKGLGDGIAVDMPVVAGTASAPMLVGRVVAVTPLSSEVMLIIDRNSAVAGKLFVSGQTGLVEGQGPGDLKMTLVNAGTDVQGAEPVFTQGYQVSGQPGLYPPGLLIGQVSRSLPAAPGDLQAFVTVRPALDFSNLDFVLVLKTAPAGIP
jgi:rod shape-determining protein MreC